jgi:hypothetical protein
VRRIALLATPQRDVDSDGRHGALDGDAIRARLEQDDLGFEVHELDPERDLAEQIDEVFDSVGDAPCDAVFYASAPVVVTAGGELFVCLDPRETETGDALDELATVFTDDADVEGQPRAGRRLFVLECRTPPSTDPLVGVACMEAIKSQLRGRAEVLAAARPADEVVVGRLSPLTRAILRAIDEHPAGAALTARSVHARIVDEAWLAGDVKALAYLSYRDPLALVQADPSAAEPEPEEPAGEGGASEPAAPDEAPAEVDEPAELEPAADDEPAASDEPVADDASAEGSPSAEDAPRFSIPEPPPSMRGSFPPGDPRTRTSALRVGAHARALARKHATAAQDLAKVGLDTAAWDELRRALAVAPNDVRPSLLRARALIAPRLGGTGGLAAIDEALEACGRDAELLAERAKMFEGAAPAVRHQAEDAWLEAIAEPSERVDAMVSTATRARERGEEARSRGLTERAHALAPDRVDLIVELRRAAARAGDPRAIAKWTKRLADEVDSTRARARLLREAATAFEAAGARDDAASALEAAVLTDPTHIGALDALTRLLGTAERWSYLAAVHKRLAADCAALEPARAVHAPRAAVLGRLGGLLRDRLNDLPGALEAFEESLIESPRDAAIHLAALLVALDIGDASAAQAHVHAAARSGHLDLDLAQRLRALWTQSADGSAAERCAIVAEALGATDDATLAAAGAARIPGAPTSPLGRRGTLAWIGDDADPEIDAFVELFAPAAIAARLEDRAMADARAELASRADVDETSAVSRAVGAAARLLAIPPPRIVAGEGPTPMTIVPGDEPVVVASLDATDGLPPRELAFLAGRTVAKLWGAHLVAQLYDADDLHALLLGAVSLGLPDAAIDPAWEDAAAAHRAAVEPWLGTEDVGALATATAGLASADIPLDPSSWLRAVDRRIDRAGLIVCGDVHAAVAVIAREAGDGERLDELLGFYLSPAYEDLLSEIGGSMMPPPDAVVEHLPGETTDPDQDSRDHDSRMDG